MDYKSKDTELARLEAQNKRLELVATFLGKEESFLENLEAKVKELKDEKLADDLSITIIEDINEFNRFIFELNIIVGAPADPQSHDALMHITDKLEDALNPQEPFKFRFEFEVDEWVQWYKKAARRCIGKNAQVWSQAKLKAVMEGLSSVYDAGKK